MFDMHFRLLDVLNSLECSSLPSLHTAKYDKPALFVNNTKLPLALHCNFPWGDESQNIDSPPIFI